MQIALIPPTELISEFMYLSDMQLLLPEPLMHNEAYRMKMAWHRENFNQYCILDNGAAEAQPVDDSQLMALIEMVRPDEFALPDVLGRAEETYERGMAFLDRYSERIKRSGAKVGYVAQGGNVTEALETTSDFIRNTGGVVETVFVPRLLTNADKRARIDFVRWAGGNTTFDRISFHLFGMSTTYPDEIAEVAETTNFVRSFDTAMPFYYAKAGRDMPVGYVDKPAPRAQYYFDQRWDIAEIVQARKNVKTVLDWKNGE